MSSGMGDIKILNANVAKLDQETNIVFEVSKICRKIDQAGYHIVFLRSLFKEHSQKTVLKSLESLGFTGPNPPKSTKSKKSHMVIPGLVFASKVPIVKWEFEKFNVQDDAPKLKLHQNTTLTGLLSVLLDFKGTHVWVFSPMYDGRKIPESEWNASLRSYFRVANKIMHSKVWTPERQPIGNHLSLIYGSYLELLWGPNSAIYDKPDEMMLGAGMRIRDTLQRFKVLRINQTAPSVPVCYGDPVLFQTPSGNFPYLPDTSPYYSTSPDPKGLQSILILVDPRHPESSAPIRDNDQFIIKDNSGHYLQTHSGFVLGGVRRLEDATMFRLNIYALAASTALDYSHPLEESAPRLPDASSANSSTNSAGADPIGEVVTVGSKVLLEEIKGSWARPHFVAVEPLMTSRWNLHCESLEVGDLEMFEIVNPKNMFDVSPVWENDRIFLKSSVGCFLSVDQKSGWVYGDLKRPDQNSFFSLAKDLPSKKKNNKRSKHERESLSKPFNVQHLTRLGLNFEWQSSDLPPDKMFTLKEELGRGAFGFVHKAIHVDGFQLAIKQINDLENKDEIQNEIDILKMCSHSNIVSYFGTVKNPNGSLWILMEYMSLGSIRSMIDGRKSPLNEKELAYVLFYILKGLNYLHSRGIIHRDIKAANILLSDHAEIKLADFGVSAVFTSLPNTNAASSTVGTPLWMAPEILRRERATPASDIWSLGITTIEMADGTPPNISTPVFRAMRQIVDLDVPSPTFLEPSSHSPALIDFVAQCLNKDPTKRPSAYQLTSHEFLIVVAFDDPKLRIKLLEDSILSRKLKMEEETPSVLETATPDPKASALEKQRTIGSKAKLEASNRNISLNSDRKLEPKKGLKQKDYVNRRANTDNNMLRIVKNQFLASKRAGMESQSHTTDSVPNTVATEEPNNFHIRRRSESIDEQTKGRKRSQTLTDYTGDTPPADLVATQQTHQSQSQTQISTKIVKGKKLSEEEGGKPKKELPNLQRRVTAITILKKEPKKEKKEPPEEKLSNWKESSSRLWSRAAKKKPDFKEKSPKSPNTLPRTPQTSRNEEVALSRLSKPLDFGPAKANDPPIENPKAEAPVDTPQSNSSSSDDKKVIVGKVGTDGVKKEPLSQSKNSSITDSGEIEIAKKDTDTTDDSCLWVFGGNQYYQLGIKNTDNHTVPTGSLLFQDGAKFVVCGSTHSLVYSGNYVYCFGENSHGQLGMGYTSSFLEPTINQAIFSNQSEVLAMACGLRQSLVLTADGKLWCFGRNTNGELGIKYVDKNNNLLTQVDTPQEIPFFNDIKIKQIACGVNSSMVLTVEGVVYVFGNNSVGQLGLGISQGENVFQPTLLNLLSDKVVVKIACKGRFAMLITDEGQLYGFGENSFGQLGLACKETQFRPRLVAAFGEKKVVDVECGLYHTMVLTDNGQLYSFGSNSYGQLGLGTTFDHDSPQLVSFFSNKKIKKLCCGLQSTIIITEDEQVFAFGNNNNGQLGLGNTHIQPTPQILSFFQDRKILSISSGADFTICITEKKKQDEKKKVLFPRSNTNKLRDESPVVPRSPELNRQDIKKPAIDSDHQDVIIERRLESERKGRKSIKDLTKSDEEIKPLKTKKKVGEKTTPTKVPPAKSSEDSKPKSELKPRPLENTSSPKKLTKLRNSESMPLIDTIEPDNEVVKKKSLKPVEPEEERKVSPQKRHLENTPKQTRKPKEALLPLQDIAESPNITPTATTILVNDTTAIDTQKFSTIKEIDGKFSDSSDYSSYSSANSSSSFSDESDEETSEENHKTKRTLDPISTSIVTFCEDSEEEPEEDSKSEPEMEEEVEVVPTQDKLRGRRFGAVQGWKKRDNLSAKPEIKVEGPLKPDPKPLDVSSKAEKHHELPPKSEAKPFDVSSKAEKHHELPPKSEAKTLEVPGKPEPKPLNVSSKAEGKHNDPPAKLDPKPPDAICKGEAKPQETPLKPEHKPLDVSSKGHHEPLKSDPEHPKPEPKPLDVSSKADPKPLDVSTKGEGKTELKVDGERGKALPEPKSPQIKRAARDDSSAPSPVQQRNISKSPQSTRKVIHVPMPVPTIPRTEEHYIHYGANFLLKWHGETQYDTIGKCISPPSPYPYLRCVSSKKNKQNTAKSSVFRLKLKQTGPVKLKKAPNVVAVLVGEVGRTVHAELLHNLLGNARDLMGQEVGTFRKGFLFVYDSIPLDPERRLCRVECDECGLVELLDGEKDWEPALSAVLKL